MTVKDAAGAELPVMVYIMAELYCRQPALLSPYYYRVIQRGFEANGLPVESLQAAWSRTIDEVWSGRIDKPKRAPERNTYKTANRSFKITSRQNGRVFLVDAVVVV